MDTETRQRIARIQAGDTLAFQRLVEDHERLVVHIVFRMVHHRADREDLCQDVFMKVYQHLKAFRHESKLSTWIATIAYNTCLNYLQKKRALLYEDITPDQETIENISGSDYIPDVITQQRDLAAKIQTEISGMDVRYRTILTLYHLDEMSYAEIGEIMDLPEGTVKSYLFRARRQLKEKLNMQYQREAL